MLSLKSETISSITSDITLIAIRGKFTDVISGAIDILCIKQICNDYDTVTLVTLVNFNLLSLQIKKANEI